MSIELTDGIALLSGAMFDYKNPEKSDVTIEDIATALSNVCRFAGHVHYFYSVAQHAFNTSYLVPVEYALDGLLHDTAEAFTNDLPTPLKTAFPVFKELEVKIEAAMSQKFGFNFPLPAEVKEADLKMLKIEKELVKGDFTEWDCLLGTTVTDEEISRLIIKPLEPQQAKALFLSRYRELTEGVRETIAA